MKNRTYIIFFVAAFLLIFIWWLSDIPIGYYKFQQACKNEGGLRVYAKVEPNVGWWAKSQSNAEGIVVHYPNVSFARFQTKDGGWKDVRYKGGIGSFSKFDVIPADETKKPRYRESIEVKAVADATRLRKEVLTIFDSFSNSVAFQSTRFIFTWTNPENTLLGQSDTAVCPSHEDEYSAIKSLLK